ncbi:hypothetical protein BLS_008325 [Venturia inaequalis]|uniref:Uncharacterized protein n=2 Tax=Venturia inaequalis TaxID=5025 RepID=A0A8H3VCT9_VENIN|nr:hypothetical protein BLS_008325 [Venturia inaequalis]
MANILLPRQPGFRASNYNNKRAIGFLRGKMKVAQVLSDLTSLRDQKAALDLVSARPGTASTVTGSVEAVRQRTAALLSGTKDQNDTDLQRAKDLVELHYAVKVKHLSKGNGGVEADESLEDARHAVKVAMEEMVSE